MAKLEPKAPQTAPGAPLPGAARIVEGRTTLLVPPDSLVRAVIPRQPAFFNPHGRLARDFAVLVARAFAREQSGTVWLADALAGVGARGLRIAVEAPEVGEVTLNDLNPVALEFARQASIANGAGARCTFSQLEACAFLTALGRTPKPPMLVDVDPFGTPAPYFDCALRAVAADGLVSVTATDTAVLCGVYPAVAFRRYYGYALRTEYCHEIGLRLLFGGLAYVAMRLERGIEPMFAHATRHYMRVYAQVRAGADEASQTAQALGPLWHCFSCGLRTTEPITGRSCPACGQPVRMAGPLWLGGLYNPELLPTLAQLAADHEFRAAAKLLSRATGEARLPPTYFVPDRIADQLNVPSRAPDAVVSALHTSGYRAARTALNPRGIRTDAPAMVVREVVRHGR